MDQASSPKHLSVFSALPVIAVTALFVIIPFLWFGTPSGHDFEFHFNSWLEVLGQWKQGIVYPHWAALAHFGYGEARFIFYPPASWTLGAALGAILPWRFVTPAYYLIALTLAGTSMFLLARRLMRPSDALFAAVFYAVNPYFLVIVYWRSAMAELLATAYFPLLLMYTLELDHGPRMIAPLSLLVAAAWLTNVPSAVLMCYAFALLAVWIAISRRSWMPLLYAALSMCLGIATAAIYLLPVWHQHDWVALNQVLSPGVRPAENFLFSVTTDHEHDLFNRIVSVVAVVEIVILGFALWITRYKRSTKIWWPLFLWGSLPTILMLKFTLPFWDYLPELRYVQFPWRWLLVLNVVLALAASIAISRGWARIVLCVITLGSVAFGWRAIQPPWWDNTGDIQEMVDNDHDGIGNEGTDEYVPAAADPSDTDQNAPLVRYQGSGSAKIAIEKWHAEDRTFAANATAPGSLELRLFNYPLWRVMVNGHRVQTQTTEGSGQMIIPLPSGNNRIEIRFVEKWDRTVGAVISLLALAIILVLAITFRKQPVNLAASQ